MTHPRIVMSGCLHCGGVQALGGVRCPSCWKRAPAQVEIDGKGVVYATTAIHRLVTGEPLADARHFAVIELDHPRTPRLLARSDVPLTVGDRVDVIQHIDGDLVTYTAGLE